MLLTEIPVGYFRMLFSMVFVECNDGNEISYLLRDVFRTLYNILDGVLCAKSQALIDVSYYCKMLHLSC